MKLAAKTATRTALAVVLGAGMLGTAYVSSRLPVNFAAGRGTPPVVSTATPTAAPPPTLAAAPQAANPSPPATPAPVAAPPVADPAPLTPAPPPAQIALAPAVTPAPSAPVAAPEAPAVSATPPTATPAAQNIAAPPLTETPGVAAPAPKPAAPTIAVLTPPAVPATPAPVNVPIIAPDAAVTPTPAPKPGEKSAAPAGEPAKQLFAAKKLPSLGRAMAIGYYPRGCLQGGVELPINGPTWQVMRLSRNRNWGHPNLVTFLEKFAPLAAKATGWKGIMVGDMAQPRGGPAPSDHMSHQTGLDVDIWFMPMPERNLSRTEREDISAINVVADDWKHLNPKTWTPQHIAFIKTAAQQPEVERVLVNAAIKQELCRVEGKNDVWMAKVRPWYGHHDHIHVRLQCPADSPNCRRQPPVPGDDGCKALDYWFSDKVLHPKPKAAGPPPRGLTMADLPPACRDVLAAPAAPSRAVTR